MTSHVQGEGVLLALLLRSNFTLFILTVWDKLFVVLFASLSGGSSRLIRIMSSLDLLLMLMVFIDLLKTQRSHGGSLSDFLKLPCLIDIWLLFPEHVLF
jgi:hypothetical protein